MATVTEALETNLNQLNTALDFGIDNISYNQTIEFTKYVKLILPLDGFVFWVKADQLSPSALFNASVFNSYAFNQTQSVLDPASTITVSGSLHYATVREQNSEELFERNQIVFTSKEDVDFFNEFGENVMWLAEFDGIKFSFSKRKPFYRQAGIYHYLGDAVYPALASQIIDDARAFDVKNVVVSNSLPIWLTLSRYMPVYPAFLSMNNVTPPYATIDITNTTAIQSVQYIDADSNHYQLVKDDVRVTIYGLRNFNAIDYVDYVLDYTLETNAMGIMNMPVVRDEKRTQPELSAIAMKKTINFEVDYYQTRVRDIARQLILSATATVTGD